MKEEWPEFKLFPTLIEIPLKAANFIIKHFSEPPYRGASEMLDYQLYDPREGDL